MNDIMSDFVNNKKGHNIVNDSFAHKPDGLLVNASMWSDLNDVGSTLQTTMVPVHLVPLTMR